MRKRYKVTFYLNDCRTPAVNLTYQKYLIGGFRKHPDVEFEVKPTILHLPVKMILNGYRISGLKFLSLPQKERHPCNYASDVGRYAILDRETASSYHVAVDGSDGWQVRDNRVFDWSDIYYKCNYWPSKEYPSQKVKPLLNGDGRLNPTMYDYLIRSRKIEKSLDLVYWTTIWAPERNRYFNEDRIHNIVEHQVRLYEALSRLRCKKSLGVELSPAQLNGLDTATIRRRLIGAGVELKNRRMPSKEFWALKTSSKVLFARPGNHFCASFRISAYLMAGGCIVYDTKPFTQWYEPLVEGRHYVNGNCGLGEEYSLPDESRYGELIEIVHNLLADEEQIEFLRCNSARYYDTYSNPEAMAQHVLRCCSEKETTLQDPSRRLQSTA